MANSLEHNLSFRSPLLGGPKSLSIAKNHPKTSQEFSEQFGPSAHELQGFNKNSLSGKSAPGKGPKVPKEYAPESQKSPERVQKSGF